MKYIIFNKPIFSDDQLLIWRDEKEYQVVKETDTLYFLTSEIDETIAMSKDSNGSIDQYDKKMIMFFVKERGVNESN